MYELSHYTFAAERDDGTVAYANTRSGHQAVVTVAQHRRLQAPEPITADETLPAAAIETLAAAGVVVPAGTDERRAAAEDYRRDRDDDDEVLLTLSPTISCNLACTYCFESSHPPVFMTRDEERDLVRFVRRQFSGRRRLQVVWFGGEPLLHPDAVLRLSGALLRTASFSGASYGAEIITNGTLLTDELAARLRAVQVSAAQITLDGTAETHNLLRPTAGGKPSYEQTVDGALAAHRHMDVNLRMNLDRRNVATVPDLLADLADRGLTGANVSFVRTEPPAVYTPIAQQAVDQMFLTVPDFAAAEVELLDTARRLGFRAAAPLATGDATPCAAVKRNHYAIEPRGKVTRCWADVADDRHTTAHLADGELTTVDREQVWRDYEPFDTGCPDCPALPICYGGCPKARIDGGMATAATPDERLAFKERYVCSPRKFNLTELLRRGLVA